MCHVSHGGMLCGVATWAFGVVPTISVSKWKYCLHIKPELAFIAIVMEPVLTLGRFSDDVD